MNENIVQQDDARTRGKPEASKCANTAHQWARGLWRLAQPLIQPARKLAWQAGSLPAAYWRFYRDIKRFRELGGDIELADIAPHLFDRNASTQSGGDEYFYQDIWALKQLKRINPAVHHDFGSRLDGFVGQATAITDVVYWDIRRPAIALPGLTRCEGNITALPINDGELECLSCLHTVEHIGLGRYGDPLDPRGTETALQELARILAPGGTMIFSMPVGAPSVQFNAFRRWDPRRPIELLASLRLLEFSAIDEHGALREDIDPEAMVGAPSGCGLYLFKKD